MASDRLRTMVTRFSLWLGRWFGSDAWKDHLLKFGIDRRRNRPAVFPHLESLESFLEAAAKNSTGVCLVLTSSLGETRLAADDPELRSRLLRASTVETALLRFEGSFHTSPGDGSPTQWWLMVGAVGQAPVVLHLASSSTLRSAEYLRRQFEEFTEKRRGHRPGTAVIELVPVQTAQEQRFHRKVETRSAVWGGLAGAVVAGAIQIVVAIANH